MKRMFRIIAALMFFVAPLAGAIATAAPASACEACLAPRLADDNSSTNFEYFPWGIGGPRYSIQMIMIGNTQYLYWLDFQVYADSSEWYWLYRVPDDDKKLCLVGVGQNGQDVCGDEWVSI